MTDWRNKTSVTTEDTLGRVATKSWRPSTWRDRHPRNLPLHRWRPGRASPHHHQRRHQPPHQLHLRRPQPPRQKRHPRRRPRLHLDPRQPRPDHQRLPPQPRRRQRSHHQRHDRRRQPWLRLRLPRPPRRRDNATLGPTNVTTYAYDNVGNLAGFVYPQRRPAQLPLQRPKPPHPRRPDQRQQHRPANLSYGLDAAGDRTNAVSPAAQA